MTTKNKEPRLLIMRHAKSDWSAPFENDHERILNERGKTQPALIAAQLDKLDISFNCAIVSSAKRTCETFSLLAESLEYEGEKIIEPKIYNAHWKTLRDCLIEQANNYQSLLIVSHNPSVSELCTHLTGRTQVFKTANLADLTPESGDLISSLEKTNSFNLRNFLTPKS